MNTTSSNKNIKLGDWTSLQKDAQAIRYAVFVEEQKIPADLEWDGWEDLSLVLVRKTK